MTFNILLLTGEQIRAARALARIEQTELARSATLSLETIKRLERIRGPVEANARTLRSIQRAFEAIGISFHGDDSGMVGITHHPMPAASPHADTDPQSGHTKPATSDRLRRLIYQGRLQESSGLGLRSEMERLHTQIHALAQELGLTGLTLVMDGVALQAIEGEHQAVEMALTRLGSGHHHEHLSLLDDRSTGQRLFSDMDFCCGHFDEDHGLDDDARLPALPFEPATLSATQAVGILMAARHLQAKSPRRGCGLPSACNLSHQCLDHRCSGQILDVDHALNPQGQSANVEVPHLGLRP